MTVTGVQCAVHCIVIELLFNIWKLWQRISKICFFSLAFFRYSLVWLLSLIMVPHPFWIFCWQVCLALVYSRNVLAQKQPVTWIILQIRYTMLNYSSKWATICWINLTNKSPFSGQKNTILWTNLLDCTYKYASFCWSNPKISH